MANSDSSEIRSVLQQQVFAPDQERLVIAIAVSPFEDKKRIRYLCLAVGKDGPYLYIIKQDKKAFRKKPDTWPLSSLREVNGRGSRSEASLDFELTFAVDQKKNSTYIWTATAVPDKNAFFVQIARLQRRFADPSQLRFISLDEDVEDQLARVGLESFDSKTDRSATNSQRTFVEEREEVLTITDKDQEDLEQVFELSRQFDYDGELLIHNLTTEINQMESANVHDLMNTHNDIENICRLIDQSLEDLNKIDKKTVKYHGLVGDVSDQVTMMDETGHKLKVQNKNIKKLIEDISTVLDTLEFNNSFRLALMDGDMTNYEKLPEILEAASVLSQILKAPLPYGFEYHPAVVKQKKTLDKLKGAFGSRVVQHLSNTFFAFSNNHAGKRDDLMLPSHKGWFRTLGAFAPVVRWMKDGLPQHYEQLLKVYVDKLAELHKWEHSDFFEKVRGKITAFADDGNAPKINPEYLLGAEEEIRLTQVDYSEYKARLDHLRQVFHQVAKCVIDEQNFLVDFFGLASDTEPVPECDLAPNASSGSLAARTNLSTQTSVYRPETPLKLKLRELFKHVDEMLTGVVATADKANKLNNMGLLVIIHEILVVVELQCPYLSRSYGGILILVKRQFDSYIKEQVLSINNARVPKRNRAGPLPFVCSFEHFAKFAEGVFGGSQRRIDLDRAYGNLLKQGIFDGINRIANHKDSKAPAEVVFFENYHRLSDILSRLKIASLEDIRRDTRQGYAGYLKSYVQGMLGKPLDKVQVFFDGVDAKIQTAGIQPHEVSFTTQFSKVELKKVLAMYPRNVVKKGLEQLYRKVEKHLSDEENLLQVVWHDMQQEFIEQYQNYLRIIEVCYPSSQITFGFGIDDILNIFQEIAASH